MPSEYDSFQAAIAAAPEDDLPRLVFADWLDERAEGDDTAHAALIRAQCQAERLLPGTRARLKLERAARSILKQHGSKWTQELADSRLVQAWEFRRGFIEHVTMSATVFVRNAKALFELMPMLRSAYFVEAANELAAVARCKFLTRLDAIDIRNMCWCGQCPIHQDIRALLYSRHLTNVTALTLTANRIDGEGAKQLAEAPAIAKVTKLDLSGNPLGGAGIATLSQSPHLKQLTTLDLSRTSPGADGIMALAASKNLPALRHLSLACNIITSIRALTAFTSSALAARLDTLDLSTTQMPESGVDILAGSALGKSCILTVRDCFFSDAGIARLKKRFGKRVKL